MATFDSFEASSVPSHKIAITRGSEVYTYWCIQDPTTLHPFSTVAHSLARRAFEIGQKLDIGQSESFEMGPDRSYLLHRIDSHEFLLKSLHCTHTNPLSNPLDA